MYVLKRQKQKKQQTLNQLAHTDSANTKYIKTISTADLIKWHVNSSRNEFM
ncbi:hypothetical protein JMA_38460 (plasmid) [Jeotgalibacillus malaysiensis]|uniref:Uncharacterized protein n=1 Tax=Jeotgalibacillus malaysiensis TaxID=1508404 RepID=A0A0B5AYU3_9BACL|nr:hypothetical protein JMA_38460 [Jeotgalibacillus malaysiensis]